ncbi:MAG: HIRAN domain-containing protein [Sphingomonas aquatilis]|uniref:HIRAN domain-containing protein n=1 Tax=Sphingomonas aquatilis TaxID=93063 RepID=UPI002F3036C5
MAWSQLSVKIVGANHPNSDGGNRRSEIAFCDAGEPVELRPEPKNPHDEHAIAAYSARGFQIGYVASDRAVLLKGLMRDGHVVTAIFQDVATWGAIARIGIDCAPVLPTPTVSEDSHDDPLPASEPDFWPDYIPPDD